MKHLILRTLRRIGFDLRRRRDVRDIFDFLKDRQIDVVLDVGANVGQFGAFLRSRGYKGKIISFEPIKSAYNSLLIRAKADGNWEANNFALGAEHGETTINVTEYSVFSSILPSTELATQLDRRATLARTETIQIRTLDEVSHSISAKSLLKIDTQGYEKQVLEGGIQNLSRFQGILMELPIVHLYKGTWQFHEALAFMASAGFVPAQIHPVIYDSRDKVSLVEVDCLFRRGY
jgi:FkbM family methyltransferase